MFDLDRFIADCRDALGERAPELAVKEVVARAMAEPHAVVSALGAPRWGEIGTLYHAPDLTVLKVIWAPGMSIYPHDHRMWAVIGLYGGREDNVFYKRERGGLARAGGRNLEIKDTVVLGRDVVHAVTNPLDEYTGAIHVYGGDFFGTPRSEFDPDTMEERPYDVEKAQRTFIEANRRVRGASSR